ncbi:MAG: branched-chain alpha-keto acid dehydrogenase subunit [Phenylobacterium sp.]|nr:branched-chain alpha-keto acid dehydrogenase subunit [Phenylobacterium sp.]
MARYVFKLPDVGEGTAEAEIVAWHVAPGDLVQEDQIVVDVMTDKATVEITSPVTGRVLERYGELGVKSAVGGDLIVFEVEGAGTPAERPAAAAPAAPEPAPAPEAAVPVAAPTAKAPQPAPSYAEAARRPAQDAAGRPLAAPAVRAYALEKGVALQFVAATGKDGRIQREDVDAYLAGGQVPAGAASGLVRRTAVEEIKVIGLRRRIAEKMQEAMRRIPHASYTEEMDVTELDDLRHHLNETKRADQPRLTLLPFLVRGLVKVLPDSPQLNATYEDEAGIIRRHAAVHVGVATQTPNGLMVPVLRHAEARDLWDIAAEITRLSAAARDGSAKAAELSGSTITLSSLGTLGGVTSSPIVNWPEVAIVAPNRIVERPMVRDGMVAVRKMMNFSMSFDHRVVDGYDAALFMQQLKGALEHPALLFMP